MNQLFGLQHRSRTDPLILKFVSLQAESPFSLDKRLKNQELLVKNKNC